MIDTGLQTKPGYKYLGYENGEFIIEKMQSLQTA
jgi:hypothetical protein